MKAISGKGGDGCTSFDRKANTPRGPPDGGNGGDGGHVIIVRLLFFLIILPEYLFSLFFGNKRVSENRTSLYGLQNHHFKAGDGTSGSGQKRNGKAGSPAIVEVPPGTIVKRVTFNDDIAESEWEEEDIDEGWQDLEEGQTINVDDLIKGDGLDPFSIDKPEPGSFSFPSPFYLSSAFSFLPSLFLLSCIPCFYLSIWNYLDFGNFNLKI